MPGSASSLTVGGSDGCTGSSESAERETGVSVQRSNDPSEVLGRPLRRFASRSAASTALARTSVSTTPPNPAFSAASFSRWPDVSSQRKRARAEEGPMGQEACVVPRPARWADDFVLDEEEVAKNSKLRRGSSEGCGIAVSKDRAVKAAAAHKGKAHQQAMPQPGASFRAEFPCAAARGGEAGR